MGEALTEAGAEAIDLGVVRDDPDALAQAFAQAAAFNPRAKLGV